MSVMTLAEADIPDGPYLVVIGKGRVRHIADDPANEYPTTWCDQFVNTVHNEFNTIDDAGVDDTKKPICGACLRSLSAKRARL